MVNKNILLRIIAIIVLLSLCTGILSGCFDFNNGDPSPDNQKPPEGNINNNDDDDAFDALLDELFEDWITNDALTMNYFLADPYRMGIERPENTFGEVSSPETIARNRQETQELSDRLDDFDQRSLRMDQQVIYEILRRNVDLFKILESEEDFSYYTGYIRPMIGIQVQLPVLFAEFNFYTAEDIERYLDLMGDTQRYFNDMIEFERERSRRGFFLSEYNVDNVIEQIESFIKDRENNLLISVFDYKIDNYPGLSNEQRDRYKQRNKDLVLNNVLSAYETLLNEMKALRGVGARQGGLADLPGGKEFAHTLLRLRVGTDRSAQEIENMLSEWMSATWYTILDLLHGEHKLFDAFVNGELGRIAEGDPKSYISLLQKQIAGDFPAIRSTQLVVLEVHESLQEHMSPAFYLAPAIDRFNENVVYVNPSSIDDDLFLFTVLAHESYPGHMYQTVYFLQQSPHPIRTALSNTGYSEGWATYAEMMSYFYAGLKYEEAVLMWNLRFFDMLLTSNIDFGVNVTGWSYDDVASFLDEFGISQKDTVDSIYNRVTGLPLNALNYSLGYIEMIELYNEAQTTLGDSFELMEFHRFILNFGSAPYPLIKKHMTSLINSGAYLRPAA